MKPFLFILLLICFTSCAPPKVYVHSFEQSGRSVPGEEVEVLRDSTDIEQPYKVIAHLSVVGAEPAYPSARGRNKIENALRDKAGALGANAVVITLDYGVGGEPVAYTGMQALDTGRNTSRSVTDGIVTNRVHTIKAIAIVYEPDRSK